MTATISQVRQALENSQTSILFLQQEHAQTLQGLYGEINKLQKKCGELTFQIAMSATSKTPSEGDLKDRVLLLEKEVSVLKSESTDMKALLDSKDKRLVFVEGQLKSQEKSFKEELKDKNLKLQTLNAELEQKSGTIAYLTTQLHQMKVKQSGKGTKSAGRDRAQNEYSTDVPIAPTPPPESAPPISARRRLRKSLSSTTAQEVTNIANKADRQPVASASEMILDIEPAKSNRGLPSRPKRTSPIHPSYKQEKDIYSSSARYRPPPSDYSEIIRASAKPEPEVVVKPTPNPLPPIASREEEPPTSVGYARKVHISRGGTRVVYPTGQEVENVLSEDNIGTIMVQSPMNSPDKGWRHVQDTNTSE